MIFQSEALQRKWRKISFIGTSEKPKIQSSISRLTDSITNEHNNQVNQTDSNNLLHDT